MYVAESQGVAWRRKMVMADPVLSSRRFLEPKVIVQGCG
jgi:hypothetical protein